MQKPDIIQIAGPAGLLETIYLPAVQTPTRGVAVGELGLLYKYNDTGRTYVRYERGFVIPFGNQLTDKVHDTELKGTQSGLIVPPAVNAASKYIANNLKSEKTDTFELGFRDYILGSSISTSFFLTDTADEITLISSGVTNPAVNR